jgi:hypothetical protein
MAGGITKGVWPQQTNRKAINYMKNWAPSGLRYGFAGAVAAAFFFDWKYVLRYVPFINTKWKDD